MLCKFALLALALCTIVTGSEYCPGVVNRYEWGGMCPTSMDRLTTKPAINVFVNHAVTSECTNLEACTNQVKAIQLHHMNIRRFPDIAFNFLIGGDGSIFEGRSWGIIGSYNVDYNNNSIGISFLGTFTDTLPSEAAILATRRLITCGIVINELNFAYNLVGHPRIIEKITQA